MNTELIKKEICSDQLSPFEKPATSEITNFWPIKFASAVKMGSNYKNKAVALRDTSSIAPPHTQKKNLAL